MTPTEFEQYLHDRIPLAAAMRVAVLEIGEETVLLRAPLEPNINPHGTVFGGSASALAILAAWSLVHLRLRAAGLRSREMIQRNTMDYLLPITGSFTARASVNDADWTPFVRMLSRKGKARIEATALLEQNGEVVGRLTGQLVALSEEH